MKANTLANYCLDRQPFNCKEIVACGKYLFNYSLTAFNFIELTQKNFSWRKLLTSLHWRLVTYTTHQMFVPAVQFDEPFLWHHKLMYEELEGTQIVPCKDGNSKD